MSKVTDEMLDVFTKGCWGPDAYTKDEYKAGFQALFDAKLISLPVDEAAIRESVVGEAVEWLQQQGLYAHAANLAEALLPTKDRAEKLADEWEPIKRGQLPAHIERYVRDFARWLIEREGA